VGYVAWRLGGFYLTPRLVISRWRRPGLYWGVMALLVLSVIAFAAIGFSNPHAST
jgi:hypothetical protein